MLGSIVRTDKIPTAIQPAVGWRTWNVAQSFGQRVLTSPDRSFVWIAPAGSAVVAHCPHDDETRRTSDFCHCGFNAFDEQASVEREEYRDARVYGTVALWGEVRRFENGWRGQYAWPKELWVRSEGATGEALAAELHVAYGCPVHLVGLPEIVKRPRFDRQSLRVHLVAVALLVSMVAAAVLAVDIAVIPLLVAFAVGCAYAIPLLLDGVGSLAQKLDKH